MKITRFYQNLSPFIKDNKVLVIFGPRRAGKTTLIKEYLKTTTLQYRLDTGDNITTVNLFANRDFQGLQEYCKRNELIVIDEAQKIPFIGQGLKIMVDHVPGIKIIVTGSSSFELAGQVGEPLTGRKTTLTLFPIWQGELKEKYNNYDLSLKIPDYLVFGSYPDIITADSKQEKIQLLEELMNAYLFKDILELEKIKSPKLIVDLLRLIAFQIGSEVSLSELGRQLGINVRTVARYLDLFEKTFVIYNLRGYSRNLRNEVTKKSKYYFYDLGVRNAVISNFNDIDARNDVGQLWENFLFIERLKKRSYAPVYANPYFWRTWEQKEIDLVEEREGKLFGYEFKWGDKKIKVPRDWAQAYPESSFEIISKENYLEFIT